jgi:energy-converting hydrogenase A subunit R
MTNIICFDLEGPLSPQDNAYEVMGLVKDGHRIFEVISRYDDILTLEGREGYEPGDTLSLIAPFLIHHKIKEEDIKRVSDSAKIVDGVKYTIERLRKLRWDYYIISTSYQQHAHNIAAKIGVSRDRIYCTKLPLDRYLATVKDADSSLIEEVEKDILESLYPALDDEKKIKDRLDRFFRSDLPKTELGKVIGEIKVVGGQRKVDAVYEIAKKKDMSLDEIVVVGDSITDYKMLREVRDKGGVAVVFNGNEYCIPYANVGLASTDMRMILVVVDAYDCGQKKGVMQAVRSWEESHDDYMNNPKAIPVDVTPEDVRDLLEEKKKDANFTRPRFHVLENADKNKQEEVLKIHKKARSLVRGEAAKLG